MSLKGFHIVFVTLSSLLAFVFAGWSLHVWRAGEGSGHLAGAALSLVFGIALIVYGFWFWQKIQTREEERQRRRKNINPVPVVVAIWVLSGPVASACEVCYGNAGGPMIDAARLGAYVLFGLVLAIQVAFAVFFVRLWRRARHYREASPR